MSEIVTILSMLHEEAQTNSATRLFRGRPVIGWTLDRLSECRTAGDRVVLCWDDQLAAATEAVTDAGGQVLTRGARQTLPALDRVTASRKWADGWRGGAFGTCAFDAGFYAPFVTEVLHDWASQSAMLIDPAAGLVDPDLVDTLVDHALRDDASEIIFTQSAPGLSGVLLRGALIERLAKASLHAGRLLHYMPDQPLPDPIGGAGCAPTPTRVARTRGCFLINSDRQIERIGRATEDLNGQLITTEAEELVHRLESWKQPDAMPREVVLELTTKRATRPIFSPLASRAVDRADLSIEQAEKLFDELGRCDDLRLTLAGMGDPLLHPRAVEIIRQAKARGVSAIHVETDLLDVDTQVVEQLVESGVDIVSVHLPATSAATYEAMMGVGRLQEVLNNIGLLLAARQKRNMGVPVVVPIFTKCQTNFGEMEGWYDHWLRLVGSAVIAGPVDYAGQIKSVGVAEMAPNTRRPCRRIERRMSILSDGRVVSCESDFEGRQCVGNLNESSLGEIWREGFEPLRESHRLGLFPQSPLCRSCNDWHRG